MHSDYVAGTRISLDSVVYSFNEGQSPETIQKDFPSLKRAQIYGAIAFYLDHQADIDKYLEDTKQEFEGRGIPMSEENPGLGANPAGAGAIVSSQTGRAPLLSIRLQADNDLKYAIVKAVRRQEPAIDFASAQEACLDGLSDPELLDPAALEVIIFHLSLITASRALFIDQNLTQQIGALGAQLFMFPTASCPATLKSARDVERRPVAG